MTSADDALFEPFTGPTIKKAASGIFASGISKRPDAYAVDIQTASPKSLYMDAATEVMDHAVKVHPLMIDVRLPLAQRPLPSHKTPSGAFRLDDMVERFHDGLTEFWVSCPGLTPPTQFEFAGRFGHFKVWRFAQQVGNTLVRQFTVDWFWIDATNGQLSAIEIGILMIHPTMRLNHAFASRNDAQSYFAT